MCVCVTQHNKRISINISLQVVFDVWRARFTVWCGLCSCVALACQLVLISIRMLFRLLSFCCFCCCCYLFAFQRETHNSEFNRKTILKDEEEIAHYNPHAHIVQTQPRIFTNYSCFSCCCCLSDYILTFFIFCSYVFFVRSLLLHTLLHHKTRIPLTRIICVIFSLRSLPFFPFYFIQFKFFYLQVYFNAVHCIIE